MQKIKMPINVFEVGTIIMIDYPYEDKNKNKRRPAVVISCTEGETTVVLLKISSVDKYQSTEKYPYAYKIKDIGESGLPKSSYVLTDKELIVPNNTKCEGCGRLSINDLEMVRLLHNRAVIDKVNIIQVYDKEPR